MKNVRTIFFAFMVCILLLTITGLALALPPTAKIVVKGVSPQMIRDAVSPKPYTTVSSGLPNVGRGSNVWLQPQALNGSTYQSTYLDTIISVSWRVIAKPAGSATTIDPTDTATGLSGLYAVMVPDSLGQYQIGLTVTTANGTSTESTLWINAAHYVGVGKIVGSTANDPECAACHDDKEAKWNKTGHSRVFTFNVDSSDHYSDNCLSCHTVGYDKTPTAVNDGFDDIATTLGWTVPVPQVTGNWDTIKANYPEIAKKANVQCENCHGPGSLHSGVRDQNQIASTYSSEVCAQCHDRKNNHIKTYQWDNSAHSRSLAEGTNIVYMNRTSCSRCHTGQGFVNEVINGQPSTAPYADVAPVTCTACHDPHSVDHPHQLRRATIADACTGCHTTRISGQSGLHHSHQGQLLLGADGVPYSGQPGTVGDWTGWELAGYQYTNSSHSAIEEKCVVCHMAEPATMADTSLIPLPYGDWANKIGGHTFKVMWDHDTPADTTDDIVNPFGCKDCHGVPTLQFVRLSQGEIHTLLEQLRVLLPHRTSGDTTQPKFFSDNSLKKIQKAGSYNYYFVNNDGSFGVHNHDYAKKLLEASIEQLKLGAGAADIVSIKDVPNDQGKQVQIVWNKFPAESFSFDPLLYYQVWRMDSASALNKSTMSVRSFSEMVKNATTGRSFLLNGAVWTFVGRVDANALPLYSLDVPTLYDSTISGGPKLTVFYVSGHAATPGVSYSALPDTGYSVDNLAPGAPTSLSPAVVTQGVQLSWELPKDADLKNIAVYRGTSANFTPTTPLATITGKVYLDNTVTNGSTYYYKLAAFDFSGNKSIYSTEVSVVVTDVAEGGGIPTEFALRQNFPNPFNPSTEIKYQLPVANHVRITIFNTLGVEVARPVDIDQQPGYYSVSWNGKDHSGLSVSSGIYLYKIESGSYSAVRKMVLMK